MVRWSYLIPRVVIVGLIVLACWVGSDPLIRRALTSKLESTTGAKVDIGQLRYSMGNHKLFLKDVAMADPTAPMQNLLQAEMIYAELDWASLLRRQIVVENGQTSKVVFGAPRTDPGTLDRFKTSTKEVPEWEPKQFPTKTEIGIAWLDSLDLIDASDASPESLELVQATKKIGNFWSEEIANQSFAIGSLVEAKSKLEKKHQSFNFNNPLRQEPVNTASEYHALTAKSKSIESRLLELQRRAAAQRRSLEVAHKHDVQNLRQSIQVTSFDSDSVSKLLLTKLQEKHVEEVVNWFQWFRHAMPDPKTNFREKNKRGTDIVFPGVEPNPGFLIQNVELEGEGRFANQHYNFAGTAHNLTSQPELHEQPASFELRAQGEQHFVVQCTVDRRNDIAKDSLSIDCPDILLPLQMLGEENSMLVTMGPASQMQANIQINAVGDSISGELVYRHSNVSLHVDRLHELAGGETTALQLNQGLASVDQFESRVTISGTIDDYDYQFQSDLGSRFAQAANRLLTDKTEQTIALRKKELDDFLDSQLKTIDEQISPELRKLYNLLQTESVEIASLGESLPTPTNRFNKIR